MAARPRTISDERIMAALAAAIGKHGPASLTLADIAREAGVTTGALVQRFGSKRALLLGFLGRGDFPRAMRAVYQAAPDPVEGLIRAVVVTAGGEVSPEEFANHLAFLNLSLADPEFRVPLAAHSRAVMAELTDYLADAIAKGQIAADDPGALASAVDSVRNGTQITWAMRREGPLDEALRRDLTTLLTPYLRPPPGAPPGDPR